MFFALSSFSKIDNLIEFNLINIYLKLNSKSNTLRDPFH